MTLSQVFTFKGEKLGHHTILVQAILYREDIHIILRSKIRSIQDVKYK